MTHMWAYKSIKCCDMCATFNRLIGTYICHINILIWRNINKNTTLFATFIFKDYLNWFSFLKIIMIVRVNLDYGKNSFLYCYDWISDFSLTLHIQRLRERDRALTSTVKIRWTRVRPLQLAPTNREIRRATTSRHVMARFPRWA